MPSSEQSPSIGPGDHRWLLFLIRPGDLLHLFHLLARDDAPELHAGHFPPDTRVVDAFFDAERNCFALMIESAFFEPVTVTRDDEGSLSAAWNQLIFQLNEVEEGTDVPADLWAETVPNDPLLLRGEETSRLPGETRLDLAGEKRWCAFFIKPTQILWLLGVLASGRRYQTQRAFPPDASLVFGTWDAERQAFGLIVSSEDFDAITVEPAAGGENGAPLRLALPERALTIIAGDGGPPPPS
jgi:hypothetical protein